MFRKHKILSPKTAFAGGLWNWTGPAIDYPVAIANTVRFRWRPIMAWGSS